MGPSTEKRGPKKGLGSVETFRRWALYAQKKGPSKGFGHLKTLEKGAHHAQKNGAHQRALKGKMGGPSCLKKGWVMGPYQTLLPP